MAKQSRVGLVQLAYCPLSQDTAVKRDQLAYDICPLSTTRPLTLTGA